MSERKPKSEKQIAAWAAYNATRHPHPTWPFGVDAGIKHCTKCCEDKPVQDFKENTRSPGGRHSWCYPCLRREERKSRKANLPKYRAREDERLADCLAWVASIKDVPCTDCGGRFPSFCMDFDHVRGVKVHPISVLVQRRASRERILAEMAKCEIVCANCHRIRTFGRGQQTHGVSAEAVA